jgi:hypothetical protein
LTELKVQQKGQPFDYFKYNDTNYHQYIRDNMDTVMRQAAAATDMNLIEDPAFHNWVKGGFERGVAEGKNTGGYDVAIAYAIKMLGVK